MFLLEHVLLSLTRKKRVCYLYLEHVLIVHVFCCMKEIKQAHDPQRVLNPGDLFLKERPDGF